MKNGVDVIIPKDGRISIETNKMKKSKQGQ